VDHVTMDIARRTRDSRTTWAFAFAVLAVMVAIVGFAGWRASEPSAARKAIDAIVRVQCDTGGNGCDHVAASAQPVWLYVGLGAGGVLLVVALALLAMRPGVPAITRADVDRRSSAMTPLTPVDRAGDDWA
jgi:hypothetical protein